MFTDYENPPQMRRLPRLGHLEGKTASDQHATRKQIHRWKNAEQSTIASWPPLRNLRKRQAAERESRLRRKSRSRGASTDVRVRMPTRKRTQERATRRIAEYAAAEEEAGRVGRDEASCCKGYERKTQEALRRTR